MKLKSYSEPDTKRRSVRNYQPSTPQIRNWRNSQTE